GGGFAVLTNALLFPFLPLPLRRTVVESGTPAAYRLHLQMETPRKIAQVGHDLSELADRMGGTAGAATLLTSTVSSVAATGHYSVLTDIARRVGRLSARPTGGKLVALCGD
ncbi:MAG: hypothetical protein U1E05_10000, partial [Patescibacteria group bacterium]|nr:hypothetical protein [Patescibacteria group bacterium]